MAYLLQYNGYTFPTTLRPDGGDRQVDLGDQELPRADGSRIQPGRRKARPITVRGDITADTADDLETILDAIRAACLPAGAVAPLYFGRDDRYYMAQVQGFSESYNQGLLFGVMASLNLSFFCAQPTAYGITPATQSLGAGGGTVTTTGDAPTLPAWTITIGTGGTGPLTLTNAATGEVATITPVSGSFTSGDVIVLTRDGYTVTLNGTATFGLLGGRIPSLAAGANVITLAAGGTATISNLSVTYTPRWY